MLKRNDPNIKVIVGVVLIIASSISIIACAIASAIFYVQNPDMTELRRFIEYPVPSIIALVSGVAAYVGKYLIDKG